MERAASGGGRKVTPSASIGSSEAGGVFARDLHAAAAGQREAPRALGPDLAATPQATDNPQEDGR